MLETKSTLSEKELHRRWHQQTNGVSASQGWQAALLPRRKPRLIPTPAHR